MNSQGQPSDRAMHLELGQGGAGLHATGANTWENQSRSGDGLGQPEQQG